MPSFQKTIFLNADLKLGNSSWKKYEKVTWLESILNFLITFSAPTSPTTEKPEASKRRVSLERRFKERSSSLSSMSTSSTSSESSESTPEPMPRQSKQRKMSGFTRNINIIMEDEISNDNSETASKSRLSANQTNNVNLPKPKTSFHRRFSQDHSSMSMNMKRSTSPLRKISLQNTSTINTDR